MAGLCTCVRIAYCPESPGNLICTSDAAADVVDARPRSPSLTKGAASALPALADTLSSSCCFLRRAKKTAPAPIAKTAATGTATAGAMTAALEPPFLSATTTSQMRASSWARWTKPLCNKKNTAHC